MSESSDNGQAVENLL